MIHIERFINELMSSNCYLVVDDDSKHCICIESVASFEDCSPFDATFSIISADRFQKSLNNEEVKDS